MMTAVGVQSSELDFPWGTFITDMKEQDVGEKKTKK